jgi:transketolase
MGKLINSLNAIKNNNSFKPYAFITNTIKGKGVSFMEDDNNWHYRIPTTEEVVLANKELNLI